MFDAVSNVELLEAVRIRIDAVAPHRVGDGRFDARGETPSGFEFIALEPQVLG